MHSEATKGQCVPLITGYPPGRTLLFLPDRPLPAAFDSTFARMIGCQATSFCSRNDLRCRGRGGNFQRLLFFLAAFAFVKAEAANPERPSVTKTEQIFALGEKAADSLPVSIRGVLLFNEPDWFLCFVGDATGVVYVTTSMSHIPPGAQVEVTGVTAYGKNSAIVSGTSVSGASLRETGPPAWPAAPELEAAQLAEPGSVQKGGVWRGITGEVTAVRPAHGGIVLTMAAGTTVVSALIPRFPEGQRLPEYLIGLTVRVQGIFQAEAGELNPEQRNVLYTASLALVEPVAASIAERFAGEVWPFSALFNFGRLRKPELGKVQGRISAVLPGQGFFLRLHESGKESGRLWVQTTAPHSFAPGADVEAAGYCEMLDQMPSLQQALLRPGPAGPPLTPLTLSAGAVQPGIHHGGLVAIDGMLLERQRQTSGDLLVMEDQATVFLARLPPDSGTSYPELVRGSRLRLTGIAMVNRIPGLPEITAPFRFHLLVRSPRDLALISGAAPSSLGLLISAALAATAALGWSLYLRRRNFHLSAEVRTRLGAEQSLLATQEKLEKTVEERTTLLREETGARHDAETVLQERGRLARELHDTLEQGLIGISLQLDAAARSTPPVTGDASRHLDLARHLLRQSKSEVRRAVWNLRSDLLGEDGLEGALRLLLAQLPADPQRTTSLTVTGPRIQLPEVCESNLLRLAQEALANALKHAHARQISLTLDYEPERVVLQIKDDGCGFDPAAPLSRGEGHFGLIGMAERTKRIGGSFTLSSAPGLGTCVEIAVATAPEPTSGSP